MLARLTNSLRRPILFRDISAMLAAVVIFLSCDAVTVHAQNNLNSGSTGADGAFAPTANQEVQIPESGVFNFTTVNIPTGVRITFRRNSRNTPVTILASGNVTIIGTIDVSGGNGRQSIFDGGRPNGGGPGGPGGFNGGGGGFSFSPFFAAASGDGPGGGVFAFEAGGGGGFAQPGGTNGCSFGLDPGGLSYGSRLLVPLIGGSGGGGHPGSTGSAGVGGGGGGGAILIASSGSITFGPDTNRVGTILARGGSTSTVGLAGGGAGGAIRLIANTITGVALVDVAGGGGGRCGNNGGHGFIRIEAFSFTGFQPRGNPTNAFNGQPIISIAQPGPVVRPDAPQLRIASLAGIPAPAITAGSFGSPPDIVVPTGQASPIDVAIEGANIPLGTVVRVSRLSEAGGLVTADSSPLAGTTEASTATASVNLPGSGMSLITATVTFTPPPPVTSSTPLTIEGERVALIEVAAEFGGASRLTYITTSGKRITPDALR